jgi:3-isopropylmalate/(R)-2-methylmalate dehydratase small subunit
MEPFRRHSGIAVPLLRDNIDTDAIIPSREIKAVSKQGLAQGLFANWRYRDANRREPDPAFPLNLPEYEGATILLAGDNFGCGSSREHAAWALTEYGIRAIVAVGFGGIFFDNCVRNGLLPVTLEETSLHALGKRVERDPRSNRVDIDLTESRLRCGDLALAFELADNARDMLLNGQDPIDLTLLNAPRIASWEAADRQRRPWVYSR